MSWSHPRRGHRTTPAGTTTSRHTRWRGSRWGPRSGTETFEVRAHEAEGEERERIWADRVAIAPGFLDYQKKTSRRIPVMILERID